ncbi:MAG: UvrD-helicase domain-containing protein [Candidatus Micrarchaeota archaeon]|nr:UvrD-helicase domain-containing protein [Candidatus Micrarchaeota archaeon]
MQKQTNSSIAKQDAPLSHNVREEVPDHVRVLKALNEIPFSVGANLLVDFLHGNAKNRSIRANRLDRLDSFGSLDLMEEDIKDILDKLTINRMVARTSPSFNKFVKVYEITREGLREIMHPTLHRSAAKGAYEGRIAKITEADRKAFKAFDFLLENFNDEQKKSIISPAKRMLCIAGAGTGKTTTLTKRIEFLVRFRSVPPEKILAITFTRKAKRQLEERLSGINGCHRVNVETFNSFCEKTLKKHGNLIYPKPVKMIDYSGKIKLVNKAIKMMGKTPTSMINMYFSPNQKRNKTEQELFMSLVNDCYYIVDFFKGEGKRISESKLMVENVGYKEKAIADRFLDMCILVDALMKKGGYRDYADQLEDALRLFRKYPDIIPHFEHILVDEYQDVNSSQIRLIDILDPGNIFAVGDPRQAIFGWRGSRVDYILEFDKKYPGAEIVPLVKNYRSGGHITSIANESIKLMGLPGIENAKDIPDAIELDNYETEKDELESVADKIETLDVEPNEIFVLARTNRQLLDLSRILKRRGIKHVVKSDELLRPKNESEDDLILSTVHAIKGLEARVVFFIGCTKTNFPCRATEHPIMDMFRMHDYDREEEERRLFYVAMTRAKERLILSYYGKSMTNYISSAMIRIISASAKNLPKLKQKKAIRKRDPKEPEFKITGNLANDLREWRFYKSDEMGLPAYRILTNSTLAEICRIKPKTLEELENVKGIGPAKLAQFGDEILRMVEFSGKQ